MECCVIKFEINEHPLSTHCAKAIGYQAPDFDHRGKCRPISHFACGASLFGKPAKIRAALRATPAPAHATILTGGEERDIVAAAKAGVDSGAVAWGFSAPADLRSLRPILFFERIEDIAPALTRPAST